MLTGDVYRSEELVVSLMCGDERKHSGEALALVARVADELNGGATRRRRHDDVIERQVPGAAEASDDWRAGVGGAVAHQHVVRAGCTAVTDGHTAAALTLCQFKYEGK